MSSVKVSLNNNVIYEINMKKIIFLVLSAAFIMSCDSEESGFTIVADIDGTNVTFECNRNNSSVGDHYSIGCQHGYDTRLNFYKDADANGGALKVEIVDVPNTAYFDSPYGIHYACNDIAGLYDPQCTGAVPQYDSVTTVMSLTNVVVPETANTTDGPDGDGVFVAGTLSQSHTISTSIVLDDVPYFQ